MSGRNSGRRQLLDPALLPPPEDSYRASHFTGFELKLAITAKGNKYFRNLSFFLCLFLMSYDSWLDGWLVG